MTGRPGRLRLLVVYLLLLGASTLWRHQHLRSPAIPSTFSVFTAQAVRGDRRLPDRPVRLVHLDLGPKDAPALLLLHGSPGGLQDFRKLAHLLAWRWRVIIPDLPGFGRSQRRVPDYSTRAHADYCLQLLDALGAERVHVVAFSMGGGVALDLYDRAPERVGSLTMVGSIGVQELELLGNYELNHLIHGLQLVFLWALDELTPHFGLLDHTALNVAYARNFFDTDQRPFRSILQHFGPPVLIIHSRDDFLVPFAAAREHHRLLPQSEWFVFPSGNHFILWTHTREVAEAIDAFLTRVEAGTAVTRDQARPERVARARLPFSSIPLEPARGFSLWILLALIVAGTFITEDLTCITTGLLIAHGRLPMVPGFLAAFLGIYLGDQLLYLAGRKMGQAAVGHAPWKWFVRDEDLRLAASWFERKGMVVILLSRFVPGTRLPTYLLAGAVKARYWLFALYFFVAVSLWTPLIIGLTLVVGERAAPLWAQLEGNAFWVLILTFATVLILLRVLLPAFTHRGRRILVGRWRRLTRWEFWPIWVVYAPVALRILSLSMRRGGFARVTAVNPGIHLGGLVGESKWDIHRKLAASRRYLPRTVFLPRKFGVDEALARARELLATPGLDLPLVLKPDRGQRGEHVYIVRSEEELEARLEGLRADGRRDGPAKKDLLLQEYVEGIEYGVFYQRPPDQERGRVLSITKKRLLELTGDGIRRLEQLILDDPRAVCMAKAYMANLADRLFEIPAEGERIRLVEIGTHSRGALFLDANHLLTPTLEEVIDRIAHTFEGFHFGRFDLRAVSEEALCEGRDFKILELNGLTGEATHFYDPKHSAGYAWKVLMTQWKDAFAIADANIARGARPATHREILREAIRFWSGTLG